jgi:Ser/Thr protein kinase RdoA (MazF antagonist)
MRFIDYSAIITLAWSRYSTSKRITTVEDISAKVSTNHVFKVNLQGGSFVIAKLSYFGHYEHFKEDHQIINVLANNLLYPYEHFVGRALTKNNEVFTYRYNRTGVDIWVVFYNPIRTLKRLPKILNLQQISTLGEELARFHQACSDIRDVLPESSKTMESDLHDLLDILNTEEGQFEHRLVIDEIRRQCALFFENSQKLHYESFDRIPVFIDWNIGNFSVTKDTKLAARWDYDWFRVSSRVLDFYFFARVVREEGDQTLFSYTVEPLMEDRFILFLQHYHKVFPLSENEVRFIKEAYRFFLLNYVVKFGRYFYLAKFALKLKKEAFETYFPSIDKTFDADRLLKALKI